MKKVLVNALFIEWGKNGGTETYLTNIIKPWYFNEKPDFEFTLLARSRPPWWKGDKNSFKLKIVDISNTFSRLTYEQITAPLVLYRNFDLIFSPGYVGSVFTSRKQIITVHDCFAWVFPKQIGLLRSIYWRFFIPPSLRKATTIIAVSNSTKSDLVKFLNIDENKITVIYESGENIIKVKPEHRINLPENYFHCVGFFKDIKNPFKIIEAYKNYREMSAKPQNLVLIGINNQ